VGREHAGKVAVVFREGMCGRTSFRVGGGAHLSLY